MTLSVDTNFIDVHSVFRPKGDSPLPVTRDRYIEGGYRAVATLADRNAIFSEHRLEMMLVGVVEDGNTYQLVGGLDNSDWTTFGGGGGGGGVPTTRNLIAGAGLVGGGTLAADRTFDIIANADGSMVINANDIQVGVITNTQHGVRAGGSLHALAVAAGAAGFMSGSDKSKIDGLPAAAPSTSLTLTAGAGLVGGGDLSANRTFDVIANADGSIVVNANDLQVGVLASDAQHGVRGGGSQHALVVSSGAAGFMLGVDKAKLDALPSTAPPTSRNLIAGAGLTGGGDLTADRTFNVVANADGSVVVNADDIQVGVLATDGQHGSRGGGSTHALAVASGAAGFLSGADKARLDGAPSGTGAANRVVFWSGTTSQTSSANLFYDGTFFRVRGTPVHADGQDLFVVDGSTGFIGFNVSAPIAPFDVRGHVFFNRQALVTDHWRWFSNPGGGANPAVFFDASTGTIAIQKDGFVGGSDSAYTLHIRGGFRVEDDPGQLFYSGATFKGALVLGQASGFGAQPAGSSLQLARNGGDPGPARINFGGTYTAGIISGDLTNWYLDWDRTTSSLAIGNRPGNAATDRLVFTTAGTATFNPSHAAADFNVQGSTAARANLLYVDASAGTGGRVGINRGTGTAGATLDVDNLAIAESILILRKNGTAAFTVGANGTVVNVPASFSTGATVESIDFDFDLGHTTTFTTGGTIAQQRAVVFRIPTYAATAATQTITAASTVTIVGAAAAGTNVTITTPASLWVQAGLTRLEGNVQMGPLVAGAAALFTGKFTAGDSYWRTSSGNNESWFNITPSGTGTVSGLGLSGTADNFSTGIARVEFSSSTGLNIHTHLSASSPVGKPLQIGIKGRNNAAAAGVPHIRIESVLLQEGNVGLGGNATSTVASPQAAVDVVGTLAFVIAAGTASITTGTKVLAGTSTSWSTLFAAGDAIGIGFPNDTGGQEVATVASVDSDTQITLVANVASTHTSVQVMRDPDLWRVSNGAASLKANIDRNGVMFSRAERVTSGPVAYKGGDQTITSSTAFADDTALTVSLAASSTYKFRIELYATAGVVSGGIKVDLAGTVGVASIKSQVSIWDDTTNTIVAFDRLTALNGGTGIGATFTTGSGYVVIEGTLETTTAGTFKLQWAQNASSVNGSVVQRNSSLITNRLSP